MPQLDTIYLFMVYVWTWTMLNLIIKTIKSTTLAKTPKPEKTDSKKPALTLPWT